MAYFYKDISLKESKVVNVALKAIKGVGLAKGLRVCYAAGINGKLGLISKKKFQLLVFLIKRMGMTEVNLDRFRHARLKLFNSLMTYKSFRLRQGLPIWGQSSRTNARTTRRLKKR